MKRLIILFVFVASTQFCYGQQITWQKYFGAPVLGQTGHGIIQMADSGFVIAAKFAGVYPYNIYMIRTDKNGDTLWTKKYNGARPEKIILTKDSGFAIVGAQWGPSILLIITDSIGDTLWTKTYPSVNLSHGYDLCQTSDSGYVIATEGSFFKVDKNGNFMWDVYMCYCNAVKEAPNGNIIATGSTCNGPDYYTVDRVSSTGQVIWNWTYGNISDNSQWYSVSDFVLLPDSNIMAVCDYDPGGWHLVKINYNTGDTMFTKIFPPGGGGGYNLPMTFAADSNIFVGYGYAIRKIDQSGNSIWHQPINFNSFEIAACSDGGIAITGEIYPAWPNVNTRVVYAKTDSLGDIYNFQGINNLYGNSETWIYPNPVTTTATLQFENAQQQQVTLTVYDVLGNVVNTQLTTGSSIVLNATALKSGMYFYTLNTGNVFYNGKFVVE